MGDARERKSIVVSFVAVQTLYLSGPARFVCPAHLTGSTELGAIFLRALLVRFTLLRLARLV